MPLNFDKVDTIINMGTAKREEYVNARSTALSGGTKDTPAKKPRKQAEKKASDNVVSQEMQTGEAKQRYAIIFSKIREAVSAAERSCQNDKEGAQSMQEMDDCVDETLTDLVEVIETIRDERKAIIAERSKEEADYAHLLP